MLPTQLEPPEIIPQVGAVLQLADEFPGPEIENGSRYWMLEGSCTLVAPSLVLSVKHVYSPNFKMGVYLPFEGIVLIEDIEAESDREGDYLVLFKLARPVNTLHPIHWRKIWKKSAKYALISGYGSWNGLNAGVNGADGLQQSCYVRLMEDKSRFDDYDTLDLIWSSEENGGKMALFNHSGGPILWTEDEGYSVVGINRERNQSRQIGAWIGNDRDDWLRGAASHECSPIPKAWSLDRALAVKPHGPRVEQFAVPRGATSAKATLNATNGFPLQMKIFAATPTSSQLEGVSHDNFATGRFLSRSIQIPAQTQAITIAVSHYKPGVENASMVHAQLCVNFS